MPITVDMHTHMVPYSIPDSAGRGSLWPTMDHHGDGVARMMINGKPFRSLDSRCWDVNRRIADMDKDGIDVQVLSPMPELLSHWFSTKDCEAMSNCVNAETEAMVARAPTRFAGLGMVPLQDIGLAVEMLRDLRRRGFRGVEIGSHLNGTPLGDPGIDPFWRAAEANDAVVLIHPLRPAGMERIGGAPDLAPSAVFPLETALAAISILAAGVLERFPKLRIVLSHGGGALPLILPRMDHARAIGLSLASTMNENPSQVAKRFWYDSIVYGPDLLSYLATTVGDQAIVLGTDYPFPILQQKPLDFITDVLGEDRAKLIAVDNAKLLFGDFEPS